MKKILILSAIVLFTSATVAYADFDFAHWQFMRSIVISAQSQNVAQNTNGANFARVVLPANISRTANAFTDLRVVTQQGQETPYLISRNSTEQGAVTQARLIDMSSTQSGQTQFVADLGQNGLIHSGIHIETNTPNYRRQVKIYASHWPIGVGSNEWSLVTDKAYIYKFTDPQTGNVSGKNDITFAPSSAQYIKVVITEGSGTDNSGPIVVTRANLYGDSHIETQTSTREVPVSVFNNIKNRTTESTLDFGGAGYLTNAVTIPVTDTNYVRRVLVESADTNASTTKWNYVGMGSISNVSTALFTGTSNRISFSEQKKQFIRLSIVNDDNRPLHIGDAQGNASVTVESPVISAIFETHPGETYSLYYGNTKARTSVYDIARLSSYIQENTVPTAYLGDENLNPSYVPIPDAGLPFTEAHKYLLNVLLALVVVVLLGGIVWYLRTYMKANKN
jgi:hypothetical protein